LSNVKPYLRQKPQKRNLKVKRRALDWRRTKLRGMSTDSLQNTKTCEIFFPKLGKKFHFVVQLKKQSTVITSNIKKPA
jgi:hypothetical protein